jgi:hypothetical protein
VGEQGTSPQKDGDGGGAHHRVGDPDHQHVGAPPRGPLEEVVDHALLAGDQIIELVEHQDHLLPLCRATLHNGASSTSTALPPAAACLAASGRKALLEELERPGRFGGLAGERLPE